MEKVLLIVSDFNLRQLYHELLFSKNVEVVPVFDISSAIIMLSSEIFTTIVMRVDENVSDAEVFLSLRKERKTWLESKVFLLTSNLELAKGLCTTDKLIDTSQFPPRQIISKIRSEIYI